MNPNPPPASPRRRAKRQASEIVRGEIVALLDLIDRLMELSEEQDSLKDLLNLLEGIGRASTRLVTLLKAERDLTVSQSKDQALIEAAARVLEAKRQKARLENCGEQGPGASEQPA